jgi:hypothetical protein
MQQVVSWSESSFLKGDLAPLYQLLSAKAIPFFVKITHLLLLMAEKCSIFCRFFVEKAVFLPYIVVACN